MVTGGIIQINKNIQEENERKRQELINFKPKIYLSKERKKELLEEELEDEESSEEDEKSESLKISNKKPKDKKNKFLKISKNKPKNKLDIIDLGKKTSKPSSSQKVEEFVSLFSDKEILEEYLLGEDDLFPKKTFKKASPRRERKEKKEDKKRYTSPPRKNTAYVKLTQAVKSELNKLPEAKERFLENKEYTYSNFVRTAGYGVIYSLDLVTSNLGKTLNLTTGGDYKAFRELMEDVGQFSRTFLRRSVRMMTNNPTLAQNVGDWTYLTIAVAGTKNPAKLFENALKKSSKKISQTAPKIVRQAVHIEALNDFSRSTRGLDLAVGGTTKTIHPRVRKINNRFPRNHEYAGKTFHMENLSNTFLGKEELVKKYPHGVPFTGTGHPDFSRYAMKKVKIEMTGDRGIDNRMANKLANYEETPKNYTWHHHHDGETMMLIPEDIHKAVNHTGGVAILKIKSNK